ncbi:MAG: fumarylacetoacetate hydrolase family protein [Candidatus Kapabacteria bacterium]|nr:fumarylacetoacetate hydrolase family protein [Candidatus Kapabacteria bacterium]
MKLCTFSPCAGVQRLGLSILDKIIDLQLCHAHAAAELGLSLPSIPSDIIEFLRLGHIAINDTLLLHNAILDGLELPESLSYTLSAITLCSPVPRPTSMRDGYAFKQHVEAARRNRGLEMIPEFYDIPIFYFTNHQAVFGPGNIPVEPLHLNQCDFELEVAIVIGKQGINISAQEADSYIAGYTIMNDWSARALQMQEMKLNLGPAKGKDFATALGPWLVTPDELEERKIETPHGNTYDLTMKTFINGEQISQGNVKDMTWTFAQIIERASYGVTLYPGDVIGSGTCGTGCFLELNGSKVYDPPRWVQTGENVVCEIDMLGSLSNILHLRQ